MHQFPETPPLDDGADLRGHLWIQELPTGGRFRFSVAESGLITFGTADETFAGVDAVPPPFRRAAEAVGTRLDRAALRDATEQPGRVTLFGRATRNEGVDYDWTALPPFVGIDVWSPRSDRLLPPDTATTVFGRLGLPTPPAVEKELRAAHAELGQYRTAAGFPPSVWRDGPAAAVLIRDKTGGRAQLERPDRDPLPAPVTQPPAELAAEHATDDRIERTADELTAAGQSPTADAIRTRLVADLARERYAQLRGTTATQAFQSAVAARVQAYLGQ
ncbi:MAG: hypothetical protein A07HB70_01990 [uncultured archaeon A07HB70]|nr:MAG: hypothetical protein A07HB70_01990 [uncultured archaeon A07HB70]